MTNIDIPDDLYKRLVAFYDKQDKLEYPTLKNFVSKKLKEVITEQKEVKEEDGATARKE